MANEFYYIFWYRVIKCLLLDVVNATTVIEVCEPMTYKFPEGCISASLNPTGDLQSGKYLYTFNMKYN